MDHPPSYLIAFEAGIAFEACITSLIARVDDTNTRTECTEFYLRDLSSRTHVALHFNREILCDLLTRAITNAHAPLVVFLLTFCEGRLPVDTLSHALYTMRPDIIDPIIADARLEERHVIPAAIAFDNAIPRSCFFEGTPTFRFEAAMEHLPVLPQDNVLTLQYREMLEERLALMLAGFGFEAVSYVARKKAENAARAKSSTKGDGKRMTAAEKKARDRESNQDIRSMFGGGKGAVGGMPEDDSDPESDFD